MTIVHSTSTARYRTTGRVVALIVAIWILMLAVNAPVLSKYGVVVDELTGTPGCVAGELAARRLYATFVSDIAIFVLKRDVKLQLTNSTPRSSRLPTSFR